MKPSNDEMFSSLGYDALRVLIGIDPNYISEQEIKRLIHLINLSEEDAHLQSQIKEIIQKHPNHMKTKVALLLRLEQCYTTNGKREEYE